MNTHGIGYSELMLQTNLHKNSNVAAAILEDQNQVFLITMQSYMTA